MAKICHYNMIQVFKKNDNYTSVQNGYSLEYNVLLEMKDDSPVTVEVKDKGDNTVIARKVIE